MYINQKIELILIFLNSYFFNCAIIRLDKNLYDLITLFYVIMKDKKIIEYFYVSKIGSLIKKNNKLNNSIKS